MDEKLLYTRIVNRYLCPFCGEWHDLEKPKALSGNMTHSGGERCPIKDNGRYDFFFAPTYNLLVNQFVWEIQMDCGAETGKYVFTPISEFKYENKNVITFETDIRFRYDRPKYESHKIYYDTSGYDCADPTTWEPRVVGSETTTLYPDKCKKRYCQKYCQGQPIHIKLGLEYDESKIIKPK